MVVVVLIVNGSLTPYCGSSIASMLSVFSGEGRNMTKTILRTALLVAGLATVGLGGAKASAQGVYPPGGVVVTVDKTSYVPGGPVSVTVSGCLAGEAVFVTINGTTWSGTADGTGKVTFNGVAPSAVGSYTTSGSCSSASVLGTSIIKVVAPTVAGTGVLPKAGGNFTLPVVPAALLVSAGAGMVVVARRRRQTSSTAS